LALERKSLRPLRALSFAESSPTSLTEIWKFVRRQRVLAVALDAPLSFSFKDQRGWRPADRILRDVLRQSGGDPGWVMSYHALMGLPIRALLLAEALSPLVGTILETHPRAGLFLSLPELREEIQKYKSRRSSRGEKARSCRLLWEALGKIAVALGKRSGLVSATGGLFPAPPEPSDGLVDALACALTAAAYHLFPENLLFLPPSRRGFGPFVVFNLKRDL